MVQLPATLMPVLLVLGAYITSVAAGGCLSNLCCFNDQTLEEQDAPSNPNPPNPKLPSKSCVNRPDSGQLWACQDPEIDFPTAKCLTEDTKLCGIIGSGVAQTLFYSFGLGIAQVKHLGDQLDPPGDFYNEMLDSDYWKQVINARMSTFQFDRDPARTPVLIARSAEALAAAAKGEVLVFVPTREGTGTGPLGAFQDPAPPKEGAPPPGPNIWLTYELPVLQRNPDVTRIVSVDLSRNLERNVDWEGMQSPPGLNNPLLPLGNADLLPVPAPLKLKARDDRELVGYCPIEEASTTPTSAISSMTSTSNTASSAPASTITSPPATSAPSCSLHPQDPDQGITEAFCLCDGSSTLSPLSVPLTGHQSDSCAYSTFPATASETITTFASTFTNDCQACTQIAFNAPSCTSVPSCTPTKAQVTVQAGSSPVHVGTLTGSALYTSISSALDKLCPSVTDTSSSTSCTTDTAKISHIDFVDGETLSHSGELLVKVDASSYNSTALRDAMIKSAALTAQKASEDPKSCYNDTSEVILKPRDDGNNNGSDIYSFPPSRILGKRQLHHQRSPLGLPPPIPITNLFCNIGSFAGVGYFSSEWRKAQNPGAEAFIDASWEFHVPPGGDFFCDFVEELEVALAVVAPEFAVEEIGLEPVIQAFCRGELGE